INEFVSALAEFRETNDKRLAELEARGTVDPLLEEKLQKIERFMEQQQRKAADAMRPQLEASPYHDELQQVKSAMVAYIRKGKTDGYAELESKGMSVGSEAD